MKNEQSFFAKQLRKIMSEKRITQQELADKLGVFQTMVSHWLTGIKNPKISSVKKIAKALDVPVGYFIDENFENADKNNNNNINLIMELIKEIRNSMEEKMKRIETELELIKIKLDNKK